MNAFVVLALIFNLLPLSTAFAGETPDARVPRHHTRRAKHVLVITDSHGVFSFGTRLTESLEKKAPDVSFYAVGGSTAVDWLEGRPLPYAYWEHHTGAEDVRCTGPTTPKIEDLVEKHSPDLVVIELGTNFIWDEFTDRERYQILDLAFSATRDGAKCVWIGPPALRFDKDIPARQAHEAQMHAFLEGMLAEHGCEVFPSWKTTQFPGTGGDGTHYDSAGEIGVAAAKDWADQSFQFILSKIRF